ncbi:MAG: hypothetical protein JKX84_04770 [Flavobacteriales bacterium]|nr:hypothetical protein [Flavobacteriales bacterium]
MATRTIWQTTGHSLRSWSGTRGFNHREHGGRHGEHRGLARRGAKVLFMKNGTGGIRYAYGMEHGFSRCSNTRRARMNADLWSL